MRHASDKLGLWRAFVHAHGDVLHISVVTLMEMRFGVEALRSRGATRQVSELEKWLLIAETIYQDRLVPVSSEIAHRAGTMLARAVAAGFAPGAEDALIAATSDVLGLRLISRNRKHMQALGVECLDPLEDLQA